jgi:SAM-dependent methyltransferase
MGEYYDDSYYSFSVSRVNPIKQAGLVVRNWLSIALPETLYKPMAQVSEHPALSSLRPILLGDLGPRHGLRSHWLDVGCGGGSLLRDMRSIGFSQLTGIDPFLSEPMDAPGYRLVRTNLSSLDGSFDVIMMHHSFEHLEDPRSALIHLRRLLAPGGVVLIRIPLSDSRLFRTYGGGWANFDPPRHFTLFTRAGMAALAKRCGFNLIHIRDDCAARCVYSSEARLLGKSELKEDVRGLFSKSQLKEWKQSADRMNREGDADQAGFYLTA